MTKKNELWENLRKAAEKAHPQPIIAGVLSSAPSTIIDGVPYFPETHQEAVYRKTASEYGMRIGKPVFIGGQYNYQLSLVGPHHTKTS